MEVCRRLRRTKPSRRFTACCRRGASSEAARRGRRFRESTWPRQSPRKRRDDGGGYEHGFAFLPGTAIDQHFARAIVSPTCRNRCRTFRNCCESGWTSRRRSCSRAMSPKSSVSTRGISIDRRKSFRGRSDHITVAADRVRLKARLLENGRRNEPHREFPDPRFVCPQEQYCIITSATSRMTFHTGKGAFSMHTLRMDTNGDRGWGAPFDSDVRDAGICRRHPRRPSADRRASGADRDSRRIRCAGKCTLSTSSSPTIPSVPNGERCLVSRRSDAGSVCGPVPSRPKFSLQQVSH